MMRKAMASNMLHEIERAIDELTPEQLQELYQWLDERHPQLIDLQLKSDLEAGSFDDLINRGLAEHKAGLSTDLDTELNANPLLWKAIKETRLVRLRYKGRERIVEPHDYGIYKGAVTLLAYQIGGSSSHSLPNWRLMEVDGISDIQLLPETFPGGRPAVSRKHRDWDQVFIRVEPPVTNGKQV
jgi:predicted DNA-binding transcriptional regulator YafY